MNAIQAFNLEQRSLAKKDVMAFTKVNLDGLVQTTEPQSNLRDSCIQRG